MAKVPLANAVTITTSDDGQATAFRFRTKDGVISFGLKNKELSRLASLILQQSEKVAVDKIANAEPGETRERGAVTLQPVLSSALGIGKGRTDSESTLWIEVGNLSLAFWVDKSAVQGLCREFSRVDELLDLQRPH